MSLRYLIACIVCVSLFSSCKTSNPLDEKSTISISQIKQDVEILAADDMEGRETGTPGEMKAALMSKSLSRKNDSAWCSL